MDLVIKNARLINDEIVNIFIENGIIKNISSENNLDRLEKKYKIIDINKSYISSGWIDSHTHTYPAYKPYSSTPDDSGYKTGVVTVVDAGTCGVDDVDIFYESLKEYKTKVYAFLNISKIGLAKIDELSDMKNLDFELAEKYLEKYPNFLLGLKARISRSIVKENGIKPLEKTINFIKNKNLKLMVHVGNAPPTIQEILNLLGKNTILSHYLNGKTNSILNEDKIIKEFTEALERGMLLDVAHGTESFAFSTGRIAKREGIPLHLTSTDIYDSNRENGPVYSLAKVMTKLLYLGYTLEEVINSVTKNPAEIFQLKNTGEIKVGNLADFTIFEIVKKETSLVDSNKEEVIFDREIVPKSVIIDGEYIEI